MSLPLRILLECSMKYCNPSCDMWAVNFLFITSSATGTGILVNNAITSKETSVSADLMIIPLRLSANPLLSLTKETFFSCASLQIFSKKF